MGLGNRLEAIAALSRAAVVLSGYDRDQDQGVMSKQVALALRSAPTGPINLPTTATATTTTTSNSEEMKSNAQKTYESRAAGRVKVTHPRRLEHLRGRDGHGSHRNVAMTSSSSRSRTRRHLHVFTSLFPIRFVVPLAFIL